MNLKIVIPSHKRHDRVFAKKLVMDPSSVWPRARQTSTVSIIQSVRLSHTPMT